MVTDVYEYNRELIACKERNIIWGKDDAVIKLGVYGAADSINVYSLRLEEGFFENIDKAVNKLYVEFSGFTHFRKDQIDVYELKDSDKLKVQVKIRLKLVPNLVVSETECDRISARALKCGMEDETNYDECEADTIMGEKNYLLNVVLTYNVGYEKHKIDRFNFTDKGVKKNSHVVGVFINSKKREVYGYAVEQRSYVYILNVAEMARMLEYKRDLDREEAVSLSRDLSRSVDLVELLDDGIIEDLDIREVKDETEFERVKFEKFKNTIDAGDLGVILYESWWGYAGRLINRVSDVKKFKV